MKELFKTVISSTNERVKNPFIGSYLISFVLVNWRAFVFLLFSKASIEDRIIVINYEYSTFLGLIIPLIIAVFYVLALPYLNLGIEKATTKASNEREKNLNEKALAKLDHKVEEAKRERKIEIERAGTSEISSLNSRIESLESDKTNLTKSLEEERKRYRDIESSSQKMFNEHQKELSSKRMDNISLKTQYISEVNRKKELEKNIDSLIKLFLNDRDIKFLQFVFSIKDKEQNVRVINNAEKSVYTKLRDMGILTENSRNKIIFTDKGSELWDLINKDVENDNS
ncbi:hypothetical protein DI487_00180 [Flavobacterium sediminis]|uniref:Uncharacterized protein n=1 Tax=Flavobacterium sediminis TaxID=2201181 RepID=A0A2U8QQW0_9FLAO|nr:hypothetical protein [Flavobacterium sediminis]AWM12449.1 hypothetical protein DI487_00180 [Flavobacterium sediminis]